MFRKKKNNKGLSWDYIKKKHSGIVDELKSLSGWNNIKASIVEAESVGDYSLVSIYAVAEVYRETRSQIKYLSEKVEMVNARVEAFESDNDEKLKHIEKDLKEIKESLEDLERRTLFLNSVEKMIPRIAELEEILESYPMEVLNKLEKTYEEKIGDEINRIVQEKMKMLEKDLKKGIFGVSVDLAKTFKEIQGRYEKLVLENYTLKEELKEREAKIAELTQEVMSLQKQLEVVNELDRKLKRYKSLTGELNKIKGTLAKITGMEDVNLALEELKEYVPKGKIKTLIDETKKLLAQIEELKRENERLKEDNKRLERTIQAFVEKDETSFKLEL